MRSIVVCVKWTAPPGADVSDDRFAGVSAADQAALETALRLAETCRAEVVVATVGPDGADRALRDGLACGASRAVRVDAPLGADSRDVAFELAQVAGEADVVLCGDYSLDRGSGSVPAFIAHHRHAAQALGLVAIDIEGCTDDAVHAVRRLDGGRREVLRVPTPCVLSVEGSVATLRRASLRGALASRDAAVDVRVAPPAHHRSAPAIVTPYRPRARVMPPPAGDDPLVRLRALTDAAGAPVRGETFTGTAADAAERIATALRDWGYLS